MQTLSAYLFEATGLSPEDVAASDASIDTALRDWLIEKGASSPSTDSGEFTSKTKGSPAGMFQRRTISSAIGTLRDLTLQEPTLAGQIFLTTVSLVISSDKLIVYATLAVKNAKAIVAPVFTDPRCPSAVKRLLDLRSDWSFGGQPVPRPQAQLLVGAEGGMRLAALLRDPTRTLPTVVVAEVDGGPIWDGLEEWLATDLAGLASVIRINEEASWSLTNEVGKIRSCYLGAVRLYWPHRHEADDDNAPKSTVWTASYMLSQDSDGKGMQRVRTMLRRSVMNVASLTVEPPAVFREIQNQASRARLKELEDRANSNSEELDLARLFIEENEELKAALDDASREVARQASKAEAAEYALSLVKAQGGANQPESTDLSESDAPNPGEVRYYKKTRNTPSYDVLVQIPDCGHNSWQGASKADKAKKGIEKLEGNGTWTNVYHCSKCTGGGVWKVVW